MKIQDLRTSFINVLSEIYDADEVTSFFYLLSEKILDLSRVDIAINLSKELTLEELNTFDLARKRLEKQEPIQYIIGSTYFYGLSFVVNSNVLIPRPETEELVDWIVKDYKNKKVQILDIGTGSGCIAVTLAKNLPEAQVYAIDISEGAIEVARENAKQNKVDVVFIKADILNMDEMLQNFDVIVSNPPYVRELEKTEIKANVLNNEPARALFVSDNEPLVFYKKITSIAVEKLNSNGTLYFEINQYLGKETKKMIQEQGFLSVTLRKDLYANDRMIKACFD
ncbi:peptide chain release factor N(5)-glutamine methyltransferase [Aquimarina aquimarini]|uniref:peptide chain release factor N(5)-glutamine methyltransferase n=1 Tax=Aquimarina aquimarini TaxID=1191734 RepID=UPI000D551A68|nr:peptide chain release factor N(5)-glutamine methyltransferase [Aquimarina aquimarini]